MSYLTIDGPVISQQLGSQMGNIAMLYIIAKKTGHKIGIKHNTLTAGWGLQLMVDGFSLSAVDIIPDNIEPTTHLLLSLDPDATLPYDIYSLSSDINYNFSSGLFHALYLNHLDKLNDIKHDLFTFKSHHVKIGDEILQSIKINGKKTVSIHFRRTDYLVCGAHNLTHEYYSTALNIFNKNEYRVLVFSDDIEYCENQLHDLLTGREVWFSKNNDRYIDMYIMSQCDANITANSTFSMWGALLNKSENLMIYPECMLHSSMNNVSAHIAHYKNTKQINIK